MAAAVRSGSLGASTRADVGSSAARLVLWLVIAFTLAGTAAEELMCTQSGVLRSAAAAGSLHATAGGSLGTQNCTFVVGSDGAATALANITVSSGARYTGASVWIYGAPGPVALGLNDCEP